MAHIQQRKKGLRKQRIGPFLLGIDEKTAAYALPAGKLSKAQNLLLDEKPGTALKRFGSREISLFPSGNAARDGAVFQKTDGSAFLLGSDGIDLYNTVDPTTQGAWVLLIAGLNFDGFLEFETAEDKIWMSNGVDPVMSWDGATLRIYDREKDNRVIEGFDEDATAVTANTIKHAQLTETDDFWNGQTLVFTRGANVGALVTITDYDQATNTITFTPAIVGAAVTDRWKMGLIIPKFRSLRFWDARLWGGSSETNTSELRFHQLTDPNTGNDIGIDHPLAWPPEFQLEIAAADGDRIWGISPVSRDRILVFKQSGIFRIERSALTIYTFEEVTKAIGSRFQRSWREKGGLIYFVGQDKDGLPDVFKTDMVSVTPVDPVGGIEPTLRGLRQPNAIQKTQLFSSASDFDAGTKSSSLTTFNSRLESEKVDDLSKLLGVLQAGSNIDIETTPGKTALLGYPEWEELYTADTTPQANDPAWTLGSVGPPQALNANGILTVTHSGGLGNEADIFKRPGVLDSSDDSFMIIRARTNGANFVMLNFGLWNGSKAVFVAIGNLNGNKTLVNEVDIGVDPDPSNFHTYHLLLKGDGNFKLWKDLVLIDSGTAPSSTLNKVQFGVGRPFNNPLVTDLGWFSSIPSEQSFFDLIHFHTNFKGDKLSTQGGKIDPITLPNNLPTTGTLIIQNDYARAPDAQRRVFANVIANEGAGVLSSFTSDTTDFSAGNDPAGFVVFNPGDAPVSLIKQFQRIKTVLTATVFDLGPLVTDFTLPFLWLSPPIFIGQNIAAWRTFIALLTQPAGTELEIKIRETIVTTIPVELDFAAFKVIVSGNNIGIILGDGVPPTTRQVQLKIEGGPSAAGAIAFLESALLQWNEGSEKILPLHAIVHKKRYQFAAAQAIAQENDIVILHDRNDAPMKFFGWAINFMVHFRGLLVAFNSNDDKILELDCPNLFKDLGLPIDASLETREESLGDEELRKDLRYTFIHTGDLAHKLDLSLRPSQSATFGAVQTITTGGIGEDIRVPLPFPSLGRRFTRKYRNNIADEGMEIKGESLYYVPRPATP